MEIASRELLLSANREAISERVRIDVRNRSRLQNLEKLWNNGLAVKSRQPMKDLRADDKLKRSRVKANDVVPPTLFLKASTSH
ncbi:hypothetical protein Nepgr_029560 [Nepenthes gracilis]|uniref:Uncharacterized protein n=1 Tax=Nepenthes gracilis TaxID=150966 RepID=A0AAD3Y343_NEPGR|nr:hypothetical protein Nepgr_029560 [Nepenthes gracilis]